MFPLSVGSNIGSYVGGAEDVDEISRARRMCEMSFDAPRFTLIFESSSTISTSKWPPGMPRFLPSDMSTPVVLAKSQYVM